MPKTAFLVGLIALLSTFLAGCHRFADYPKDTVIDIVDQSPAVVQLLEVSVPPPGEEVIKEYEYRVGPGDVLSIEVAGLIERGNTFDVGSPEVRGNRDIWGFRVYASGKVLLPLVGGVEVAGLSVEQVQQKMIGVFSTYIRQPVVSVEILDFKSQPLYLLGKFAKPGLYYLDRATSLLHGVALGGGLDPKANLRGARVIRDKQVLPVDLYQLFHQNDQRQNVMLRPGDTVYVPNSEDQQVYVFGAGVRSGAVPMVNGRLNLVQALSSAGMSGRPYEHEKIRLIRTLSPTRGQLMVVDLGLMINGQAMPMPLQDGDIIYVPKTPLGGWNEVIEELLPTFQLIGAIAQPFLLADEIDDEYDD